MSRSQESLSSSDEVYAGDPLGVPGIDVQAHAHSATKQDVILTSSRGLGWKDKIRRLEARQRSYYQVHDAVESMQPSLAGFPISVRSAHAYGLVRMRPHASYLGVEPGLVVERMDRQTYWEEVSDPYLFSVPDSWRLGLAIGYTEFLRSLHEKNAVYRDHKMRGSLVWRFDELKGKIELGIRDPGQIALLDNASSISAWNREMQMTTGVEFYEKLLNGLVEKSPLDFINAETYSQYLQMTFQRVLQRNLRTSPEDWSADIYGKRNQYRDRIHRLVRASDFFGKPKDLLRVLYHTAGLAMQMTRFEERFGALRERNSSGYDAREDDVRLYLPNSEGFQITASDFNNSRCMMLVLKPGETSEYLIFSTQVLLRQDTTLLPGGIPIPENSLSARIMLGFNPFGEVVRSTINFNRKDKQNVHEDQPVNNRELIIALIRTVGKSVDSLGILPELT